MGDKEREIVVGARTETPPPELIVETMRPFLAGKDFRKGVEAINFELDQQEQGLAVKIREILGKKVQGLMNSQEPALVVVKIPDNLSWFVGGSEQPPSLKESKVLRRLNPNFIDNALIDANQYLIRDDGQVFFELCWLIGETEEIKFRYRLSDSDLITLGPAFEKELNDALTGRKELTALALV